MELKVGQKVKIQNRDWFNSLGSNRWYGPSGNYYNEEMRSYANMVVTIKELECCPKSDDNCYIWFEEVCWTWHTEAILPIFTKSAIYRPSQRAISLYNVWRNMKADGFDRPWVEKFVQDVVFNGTTPRVAMKKITPHTTYVDDAILSTMCNYVAGRNSEIASIIPDEDRKWLTYLIAR